MPQNENYLEKHWRLKQVAAWLLLIIVCFFISYLKVKFVTKTDQSVIVDVMDGLISSLLTLAVFGFFYEMYTKAENRKVAKMDIVNAMHLDNSSIKLFSVNARLEFVRNIIGSIIGEKYGNFFHEHIITRYVAGNIAYRENFEYDVELNEAHRDFTFKGEKMLLRNEYYSMTQTLVYTKHFKKETKDVGFKIIFAFDDKSLDYWMNEDFVFFREVININEWEADITNYTQEDFADFAEKCLGIKLTFFDKNNRSVEIRAEYDIRYINNDKARGIEIVLRDKQQMKELLFTDDYSVSYRCKLNFEMPMNKKLTRFHFALPEPTINPKFSVRFDRHFKNIDYFTHFSNSFQTPEVTVNGSKYSLSASQIIYPRSGVIFFWDAS